MQVDKLLAIDEILRSHTFHQLQLLCQASETVERRMLFTKNWKSGRKRESN